MSAKIYCEHRWLHTHKGLPYEVTVKTMALPTGCRFTAQGMQAAYGRPLIRVHIGGQWMGDVALQGEPEMAETAARRFVERHLKIWEQVGLIGPHLSSKGCLARAGGPDAVPGRNGQREAPARGGIGGE